MRVGLDAIGGSGAVVVGLTPGGACRVVCALIHDIICFLALSAFSSAVTNATLVLTAEYSKSRCHHLQTLLPSSALRATTSNIPPDNQWAGSSS